ncbi:MAG: FAD binding domain-containing protein [Myxococcales bacterium]|jgi:CO/xanthine dehydrogenase FAD-binding subunit
MAIDIVRAENLEHALELLARDGAQARPLAGGTDLMLRLRAGRLAARTLVSIADLSDLAYVREEADRVELGALTLIADLITDPVYSREFPAGVRAARDFASPQIRNRGTLGGNVGNASPAADNVPPLITFGATVELRSKRGSRSMPIEDLFEGPGRTKVAPDEMIVGFQVPKRPGAFQFFAKFGNRGANVISIASAALCLQLDGETVREARVAYGCCAPVPLRARRVESYLTGQKIDERLIAGVREAVLADIKPIDDVRGSRRYKELLVIHATEDALRGALESARKAA